MTHKIRISVVVENTACGAGLLGEHGLAYWIEWEGRRVLLDTGQGSVLASNAFKLDVPLHQADAVILSHGHYDHCGALADVLRVNRPYVFAHPAALEPKFARNQDGTSRQIGIPATAEHALRERRGSLVATSSPTPVFGLLCLTGPVPRVTDFEDTGGPFFLDAPCSRPDPLVDDQAVFFETRDGVVVLLGCAHSGVVNTLQYVDRLTGGKPIHAVLGGMHLVGASPQRLARTIESLRSWDIPLLAPAHCTGMPATAALWNAFPGNCTTCHVGKRFEFNAE
jgi:7,8-dihydropterin-6-yl-methyl-4-(beta-D-ribofuranosyl)aminobenzene 5'-phosphate synthase